MKEIKKILIGVASFVVLLVLADWAVGTWSEKMYYNSKYGIYRRQIYCINESEDELIILGSSRANHQYVSSIFKDTLGLSTFNAGSEGQSVYYHYVILQSMINRDHFPNLVILDILDLDVTRVNSASFSLDATLDRLTPHYREIPQLQELFKTKGVKERIKVLSKTFLYNSKLVQLIKCNYFPLEEDNGYEVVHGELAKEIEFNSEVNSDIELDSLKIEYLERIIETCDNNNVPLVVVYSPIYSNSKSLALETIESICQKNDMVFLNHSNDDTFMVRDYFRDIMHLNDRGARIWSIFLANEIYSLNILQKQ